MTTRRQKTKDRSRTVSPALEGETNLLALKRQPLLLLMFAGILFFYLLLLTKNYYWDGIFFARTIEEAKSLDVSLLHPNHLFYNVLGYLFYQTARAVGLQPRAVTVLQVLNCFFGVASAYVLFRILLEAFKSIYVSIVLTLLFAFSATWWKFATDADSYIASVFFLLLSTRLLLPQRGRRPRPFLVAVLHSLSMFFHELAVLFFPAAIVGILLQTSGRPTRERAVEILKYGLTAFVLTFPAFYLSFRFVTGSFAFKPFLAWVTTFSPEHGFTFNAWDNFSYTLRGHSRLFVGGRLAFLRDLKSPLVYALAGVTLVLAALFFFKLFRHPRELKASLRASVKEASGFRALRILSLVWIVCYLVFLFFFIPQNTFYRLFYLPALVLLAGTFLAPAEQTRGHVRRNRAAVFAALVIAANLTFSAYPYAQVSANPPLALAFRLNRAWPPGTTVRFASWNSDNELIKYFNPSSVWREAAPETLEKELREKPRDGAPIWIETTLIDLYRTTPEGRAWLDAHTERHAEHELVNDKFKLQFYEVKPESFDETR